jgi:hypothetical protein
MLTATSVRLQGRIPDRFFQFRRSRIASLFHFTAVQLLSFSPMDSNFSYHPPDISISRSDIISRHSHNIEFSRQYQHFGPDLSQDFQRGSGFSTRVNLFQPRGTLHIYLDDLKLFVIYSDQTHRLCDGNSFVKLCCVIESMIPVLENITKSHDLHAHPKTVIMDFLTADSADMLSDQPINMNHLRREMTIKFTQQILQGSQ